MSLNAGWVDEWKGGCECFYFLAAWWTGELNVGVRHGGWVSGMVSAYLPTSLSVERVRTNNLTTEQLNNLTT